MNRNKASGRYSFDGNFERLCKCGHTLGIHTGEPPHACGNYGTGLVDCDCTKFNLQRPAPKLKGKVRHNIGRTLIDLTNGAYAVIDEDDFDYISQWRWRVHNTGYACRMIYAGIEERMKGNKTKTVFMHAAINKTPDGLVTDHLNSNRLDNRKSNLQSVTQHVNSVRGAMKPPKNNKSGYPGVNFRKDTKKWRAFIKFEYRQITLGCYRTKEEAINARKLGEKKYWEFAQYDK